MHREEALQLRQERGYALGIIELVKRHRAEHRELYRAAVAKLGGQGGKEAGATWRFEAPLTITPRTTSVAAGGSA
jgi:hypothetical protein